MRDIASILILVVQAAAAAIAKRFAIKVIVFLEMTSYVHAAAMAIAMNMKTVKAAIVSMITIDAHGIVIATSAKNASLAIVFRLLHQVLRNLAMMILTVILAMIAIMMDIASRNVSQIPNVVLGKFVILVIVSKKSACSI